MCFHSKQTVKAQKIENTFRAKFEEINSYKPTRHYNGFEFPKTPVITNEQNNLIQMLNWGLLPNWANEDWNKTYTLNARIETIHEKASFKGIQNNRCIVLVNGFYEWKKVGASKHKYEINVKDEPFAFAGLYDEYKGLKTYTIITTEAQGIMREIHNTKLRMPLTLTKEEDYHNWLNGKEVRPFYDFNTIALEKNIQTNLFD
ncbi:MAG: SOS response-associated peptidase [Flavobacteriales bacterium]|nr:SOS response-associated peptidase [Flavobacteriales bacterium]